MISRFLVPATFGLLIGCVSYVPHPLDPSAGAARLSDRRLPERVWTLEALVAEALRENPAQIVAEAQYRTARAGIRAAGERPNPTVLLTPQIVTPYTSLIAGTYGIDFDWTVETAGKRSHRLEIAQKNARLAAIHLIEAHWKIRVAVRKAFLDFHTAQKRAGLLATAIAQQGAVLDALNTRIGAGEESRTLMTQPRLLRIQLQLQSSDADKSLAIARAALAEALGLPVSGLAGAKFSFAVFEHLPRRQGNFRREAVTRRADVMAALAEYVVAEANLRLEVAKQYPDLHLNPGYQIDAGENKWTVGVGLTLPVLNQNRGAIAEAEAKREESAAQFRAVQSAVLADCDRAAALVAAAQKKLALTDSLLAEQEKALASEDRLAAAGGGDKIALLSLRLERTTTLLQRLDAWAELHAAYGTLEEATQSPLDP